MLFTGATGQHCQRVFLLGRDETGRTLHPELLAGGYDWKEIRQTVNAPDGAVRMALFLGILPCKGRLGFDDIDIKTETAPSPAAIAGLDALPPRLPLERIRQKFPIDLSKLANRALADEEASDGRGGWSDDGPAADMRALKTGKVQFGGVPFEIPAEPRSIIVLKSPSRNPGDLPEKVTIPVGKKLDTLFFLHAAASASEGDDLDFLYDLHYADGKVVRLVVTGSNLADWTAAPVAWFDKEQQTVSTAAMTVPVPRFGQGTIYRMEWSAPADRRAVELQSIDFVGGGRAVPILLGITGVQEW
jgi:hypothetical protein